MNRGSSGTTRRVAAARIHRRPEYRLFHQIVGLLHELLPARLPIDVCLGIGDGRRYGECTLEPSRFRIRVSHRLPEEFAIEVLIHEWAHALSWPRGQHRCSYRWQPIAIRGPIDHDAAWGRAYAKVYCRVVFEILPRLQKAKRAAQRSKRKGRSNEQEKKNRRPRSNPLQHNAFPMGTPRDLNAAVARSKRDSR
jgi:hypothetical protein